MSRQKKALISGITGQDGSYLAGLLLSKGYDVHGIVRRSSSTDYWRLNDILSLITLHQGDLLDHTSLSRIVVEVEPDEVYNLAGQSFVGASWDQPVATSEMTAVGVTRILEAIRHSGRRGVIRFYQASSSEQFGVSAGPQSETTPFHPRSPYGVSKAYAHWMTVNYRESYDMFCCCGILFNHESPRRGPEFVTRKISQAVARIHLGLQDKLQLGNLDAQRDWGFAGDYVEAMWAMLQCDCPDDYVIATGRSHSVREFAQKAFAAVDLAYEDYVETDKALLRPAEINVLCGDYSKAKRNLNWEPRMSFDELVRNMVFADIHRNIPT